MKFEDEVFDEYIVMNSPEIIKMITEFTLNMLRKDFEYIESGGRCYFTGLPGVTMADRRELESASSLLIDKTHDKIEFNVMVHDPARLDNVLSKYNVGTIQEFVELAVYRYKPTGLTLSLVAMKHLIEVIRSKHPLVAESLWKARVVNNMCSN